MKQLLAGLLGALLFINLSWADDSSSAPRQEDIGTPTGFATNNAAYQDLRKVMMDDDAALDEVNSWIQENNSFAAKGAGETKADLNKRILARLQTVRTEYEDFLKRYTNCAPGYLAYGSFLSDIGDEHAASLQFEKSKQLDPKNPAVWNNLANYYGENSPVTNAFADYQKAIDLDPTEPVYYENFATTVYLYRKDAREFYNINETQVFDKSLALYRKAIQLDPDNFTLQTEYAESYYGIKPLRVHDALEAWTNALTVAHSDLEREGVYIHLARVKIAAGYYAEAQAQLDEITNSAYDTLKRIQERSMLQHEQRATNSIAGTNTLSITMPQTPGSTNSSAATAGQKTP